jgi:hypothetical protein
MGSFQMQRSYKDLGFLSAAALLHGAAFGGIWWNAVEGESARAAPLSGETLVDIAPGDNSDTATAQRLSEQSTQTPKAADILEPFEESPAQAEAIDAERRAPSPSARPSAPSRSAGASRTSADRQTGMARSSVEDSSGRSGAAARFGAVGERGAQDLAAAFTRAFPQTASTDPSWSHAAFGSTGTATVHLTLDSEGHIRSHSAIGGNSELQSGIARTLLLLRARAFTARAATTTLRITAKVTPDQVHDGLHGDVFAIGGSMTGAVGNAFFALAIGRRIDVKVVTF